MARKQASKATEGNGVSASKKSVRKAGHKETRSSSPNSPSKGLPWNNWLIIAVILALVTGWIHGVHISSMFEKDRHFSHLSSLERDLTFRTEMGLYYSYYQTIIEAPTISQGVHAILADNITEYPSKINTLKRFNLYPELILGVAYRMFTSFTTANKIKTMECWQINRGELPPVSSCEGVGDKHYFYITNIFFLNGIMQSIIFMYGWYLGGESIWGGIFAVSFYFFNHGESTRVMWTPPLRESFSFPFLILEMFLVTHMIKTPRPTTKHSIWIGLAAFAFMLPWQFAQFALLTQTAAVFALYLLEFIGSYKIKLLLYAQISALLANFVLQFGNEMLLTSFYASSLITILAIILLEPKIEAIIKNFFVKIIFRGLLWIIGTFSLKKAIASALFIADDAHIWDILRSKFSDFNNFHTMLYTCAKEFDFIEISTMFSLSKTLLLPCNIVICVMVVSKCLKYEYSLYAAKQESTDEKTGGENSDSSTEEDSKPRKVQSLPKKQKKVVAIVDTKVDIAFRSKPNAEIVYNILQMCAFTMMAILLMRLKLFMTPSMCIVMSILSNRQIFTFSKHRRGAFLAVVLAMACVQGFQNLAGQWNIIGEFENWPHEQLIDHINEKMPQNAVFAGAMPTMASIKLSCKRAIVNHPHYEDAGLRERTKKVYSMYGRRPLNMVHETITNMNVTHYVLENSWCTRKTRDGCAMPEIWDLEDVEYRGRTPACEVARNNPKPYFTEVFKNNIYTLLKVNKLKKMEK